MEGGARHKGIRAARCGGFGEERGSRPAFQALVRGGDTAPVPAFGAAAAQVAPHSALRQAGQVRRDGWVDGWARRRRVPVPDVATTQTSGPPAGSSPALPGASAPPVPVTATSSVKAAVFPARAALRYRKTVIVSTPDEGSVPSNRLGRSGISPVTSASSPGPRPGSERLRQSDGLTEVSAMLICCPASAASLQAMQLRPVMEPETVVPVVPGAKRSSSVRAGASWVRPGGGGPQSGNSGQSGNHQRCCDPLCCPGGCANSHEKAGYPLGHCRKSVFSSARLRGKTRKRASRVTGSTGDAAPAR
jgi:hypothetical protein